MKKFMCLAPISVNMNIGSSSWEDDQMSTSSGEETASESEDEDMPFLTEEETIKVFYRTCQVRFQYSCTTVRSMRTFSCAKSAQSSISLPRAIFLMASSIILGSQTTTDSTSSVQEEFW